MQPGGFPPPDGGREVVRVHAKDQRDVRLVLWRALAGVREDGQAEGDEVLRKRDEELRSPEADLLPD